MNITINTAKLRLVQINTTAWQEEDILLITNLTDKQIESVVTPIVERERESGEWVYVNDDLAEALRCKFPKKVVINYNLSGADLIKI